MSCSLGQVFTPQHIVQKMLALRTHFGRTLEPSCGDGAFSQHIKDCVAIEYDEDVAADGALVMDFFDYYMLRAEGVFDTVIGNPPYVRYKEIDDYVKVTLECEWSDYFDKRSNLCLFFILKSAMHLVDGGELIFIVPREFRNATSARKLNQWLYDNGSFTHWEELGDEKVFAGASPNIVIFRWQKGLKERTLSDGRVFSCINGQLLFNKPSESGCVRLGDIFDVRVGAVSGCDEVFKHPVGNVGFVCSSTFKDGAVRKMICIEDVDNAVYNTLKWWMYGNKDKLIARKIRKFNEDNYWEWGRSVNPLPSQSRVYVNCKTRNTKPFFQHKCDYWDGSILALFPKSTCEAFCTDFAERLLNGVDWESLGFKVGGRLCFGQKSLENTMLPEEFNVLLKRITTER